MNPYLITCATEKDVLQAKKQQRIHKALNKVKTRKAQTPLKDAPLPGRDAI